MMRSLTAVLAFVLAVVLGGCQGMGGSQPVPVEVRSGKIEQITPVQLEGDHDVGLGAILGGVAGAGLGSLIGAGTGKDVAIAAGAIGGAFLGNYAQKKYESKQPGEQIVVRLTSGVLVVVTQPVGSYLRVGQRVYVEGAGQSARVVAQNP